MKFNRAKMDKLRNAVARNAKMQMQSPEPNEIGPDMNDDEASESPQVQRREQMPRQMPQRPSKKHYKSGGGWTGGQ